MSSTDALIIAAIVAVFVAFGLVLAWGEYQTRDLGRPVRQGGQKGNGSAGATKPQPPKAEHKQLNAA